MYYLALLAAEEGGPASVPGTDEYAASMQRHQEFWTRAQEAVAGGGLYPGSEAATIRDDGGGNAVVTDGPFAEVTEVVGGYYVFDAADLDAALSRVRQIPEVSTGHVELWPMVFWNSQDEPMDSWWAALLREPSGAANEPGSAEWEARVTEHKRFGEIAGRPNQGIRRTVPAGVGDDRAAARRGDTADRRTVHRGRRDRERYLRAVRSRPGRGDRARLADSGRIQGCVELRQIVAG